MATSEINNGEERRPLERDPQKMQRFSDSWKNAGQQTPADFIEFIKQRADYLFGTPNGAWFIIQMTYNMTVTIKSAPGSKQDIDNDFAVTEGLSEKDAATFANVRSLLKERWTYLNETKNTQLLDMLRGCDNIATFESIMSEAIGLKQQCETFSKVYQATLSRIEKFKKHLSEYAELRHSMAEFDQTLEKYKKEKLCAEFKNSSEYKSYVKKPKKGSLIKVSVEEYVQDIHDKFRAFYLDETYSILDACKKSAWKNSKDTLNNLNGQPYDENKKWEDFKEELKKLADKFMTSVIREKKNEEVSAVTERMSLVEDTSKIKKKTDKKGNDGFWRFVDGKERQEQSISEEYATMGLENLNALLHRIYPTSSSGELSLKIMKKEGVISKSVKAVLIKGDGRWGKFKIDVTDPDIYFTPTAYNSLFK